MDNIKLDNTIILYVPIIEGKHNIIEYTIGRLIDWFGGITTTEGFGYWKDDKGNIIEDDILLINIKVTEEILMRYTVSINILCQILKKQLNQDCIALEINGEMKLL